MPTSNPNQRWGHGIWIGEAPTTDECIIPSERGSRKRNRLHRVTTKEKFLTSELKKAREYPWNNVSENLKSAIETRQDQDSSGHRRMHRQTIEIVMRIGATPGCSGCAGSRSHMEACRVRSRRTLADAKETKSSRAFESRSRINCKNDRGAPTAYSGDASATVTITIFPPYCADARTDTKRSERADGFTDANGSTGTQRAKESATE